MHKNLLPDELRDRALDEYNKAIAKGELDRHEKSAVVFFGENPNECKVVSRKNPNSRLEPALRLKHVLVHVLETVVQIDIILLGQDMLQQPESQSRNLRLIFSHDAS